MTDFHAMQQRSRSDATEHRKKLFGWISVENLVQTILLIGTLLLAFQKQRDDVETMKAGQAQVSSQVREVQSTLIDQSKLLAVHSEQIEQQSEKAKTLFDSRAEDRKVLNDVAGNVGILLDRTKPK